MELVAIPRRSETENAGSALKRGAFKFSSGKFSQRETSRHGTEVSGTENRGSLIRPYARQTFG